MVKHVTFRKATALDIPFLHIFIAEQGKNRWHALSEQQIQTQIACIASHHVEVFLAEIGNQCIGFACFHYEEKTLPQTAYLSEVIIHQDYRDQPIENKLITILKAYLAANNISFGSC